MTIQNPKSQKRTKKSKQTFSDHIHELRNRIFIWFLVLGLGSVCGYFLNDKILEILIRPLNQPIFYVSPTGGFDFVLRLSVFFGFIVALPVFIYEAVRFIEPALTKKFALLLPTVLISSGFLLILGMSFAYFVSLPGTLYFLGKFTTNQVQALISTNEYLSFVTTYLLGFGIAFQLPLLMLAVNAVKKIEARKLLGYEQWVFLGSFVAAAILTPTPDLFNQLIMAGPLILLYQLVIVLIWIVNKYRD